MRTIKYPQGIKTEHFALRPADRRRKGKDGKYNQVYCVFLHGPNYDLIWDNVVYGRVSYFLFLAFSDNNPLKRSKKNNHKQIFNMLESK